MRDDLEAARSVGGTPTEELPLAFCETLGGQRKRRNLVSSKVGERSERCGIRVDVFQKEAVFPGTDNG